MESLPGGWVLVEEESPREFLLRHGQSGRIGLLGGSPLGHKLVRWGQAPLTSDGRWSLWSHVVIFAEDNGEPVLYESDFDLRLFPPGLRNGAQMSPVEKYFSARRWPYMSILDFHLTESQIRAVVDACRTMIQAGVRYAVRGLLGAGFFYRLGGAIPGAGQGRPRELFCSAFVQEAFVEAGIRFQEGVPFRYLGPEHIWQTAVPHLTYLRRKEWEVLQRRGAGGSSVSSLRQERRLLAQGRDQDPPGHDRSLST
jgi:hypothetical protein